MTWAKGQSGNPKGRPLGSRHKLSEAIIRALVDDFNEHGLETIKRVRAEKPDAYLGLISRLLPQTMELDVTDARRSVSEYTTAELLAALDEARAPLLLEKNSAA